MCNACRKVPLMAFIELEESHDDDRRRRRRRLVLRLYEETDESCSFSLYIFLVPKDPMG